MKLYREHGINPAAAMGGCLLSLCQMPIFMGLYYALQESVFFRLEPVFGSAWIPNLAAPDMLAWWSESIPFISEPEDLGGMIYLGPYFNLLPVIAVVAHDVLAVENAAKVGGPADPDAAEDDEDHDDPHAVFLLQVGGGPCDLLHLFECLGDDRKEAAAKKGNTP